MTRDGALQISH